MDIWCKNIAINAGIDPGGSQFCRGVKSIPINGVFDMSTCDVKTEHGNSYKQTEGKKKKTGQKKMGFEKLAGKLTEKR